MSKIEPREIVQEMKESYIDYAMSVIVMRALPDIRDGLKPVHRRILYAMYEMGLGPTAKFRKSATMVGEVLGKYHPHGDSSVYSAAIRMAQDFSLRYPLIQGQGNVGCFTKDTKVRLTDGRNLSFEELIKEKKEGKRHWTFTFNHQAKKIEITEIKNPRLTKKKEKIIEIILDNGEKIKCTLDHRFMLRDGSYKEAKDLKSGESLMPFYKKLYDDEDKNLKGYEMVYQPIKENWEFIHRLADEWNLRKGLYAKSAGRIRHHNDFNKLNNNPDNILRIQWQDHWKYHKEIASEQHKNNSEYVKKITEGRRKFWAKKENKKLRLKLQTERNKMMWQNPKYRKIWIDARKKRWQDPSYKERIIKSKILGYTYSLLNKYQKVTPEIYEKERYNNCIPRIEKTLNYFNSFSEILTESQKYNHKIVKTKIFRTREDVYDLTVEPWHNFVLTAGVFVHNSIDDPSEFAAMRYSEMKMSKMGEIMLEDIKKETVDFRNNYDESRQEPVVLPSMIPQLLLNGSLGIAVGMATNIPPHNLNEVCDALIYLIKNPEITTDDLCKFIKAPDFPTGGIIYNRQNDFPDIYSQGKGKIILRGKTEIENTDDGKTKIIITEIPYQVQKGLLIQQFAKLVADKKIEGIRDIRDESDRKGMRIVIDLQKNQNSQKILNRFFKFSDLQITYHLNLVALINKEGALQPRLLSLLEILNYFLEHRKEVVYKRTEFNLKKAEARAHILEGLHKCLNDIDLVITIIKKSEDRTKAKDNLKIKIGLTEVQADAILETKLSALAKMEQARIADELKLRISEIKEYKGILADPKEIQKIIITETERIKKEFGDKRRTQIVFDANSAEISEIDLIPNEETIITISKTGYIKRINPSVYKQQHRGGKGVVGMKTGENDIVEHFVSATTHSDLLFFTDTGKVFETKAYEIPEATRTAKGRGLINFLELSAEEKVLSLIMRVELDKKEQFLMMGTKNGVIKKMNFANFAKIRKSGLIAINLRPGDLLIQANIISEKDDIILVTKLGKAISFAQTDIREVGRIASGVRGIRLQKDDEVIAMEIIQNKKTKEVIDKINNEQQKKAKGYLLTISENGIGKKTDISQYKIQKRGGKGVKTSNISKKTGNLVYAKIINSDFLDKDLIIISKNGQVIRIKVSSIPTLNRSTQGVRIMRLSVGDKISRALLN